MSYQYPISTDWSTDEIVNVVKFFSCIETAYEKGIERELLIHSYQEFKKVVTSKSEEKKICGQFEDESHYSCYQTMKKAKDDTNLKIIKMK